MRTSSLVNIPIVNNTDADEMIIFIVGSKGTLADYNYIDYLENSTERYFYTRNFMLIYSQQIL
jgi:hypothetical protein